MNTNTCLNTTTTKINETVEPKLNYKGSITHAQMSADRKTRVMIANPFSNTAA